MPRLMHISHRGAVYWEWQLANILIVFLLYYVEWYLLHQNVDMFAVQTYTILCLYDNQIIAF